MKLLEKGWMIAVHLGCSGADVSKPPDDTGDADADTDSDTDSDADTDSDTDSDADTDTATQLGLIVRTGSATAGLVDFVGTEEWIFTGDEGYGDVLCHITYELASAVPRGDCPVCDWAYDLTSANAAVVTDVDAACQTVFQLDATTVSSLDGVLHSYGYNPDYFGHAQVLMEYDGVEWSASAYAEYDEATSAFSYEWEEEEHAY